MICGISQPGVAFTYGYASNTDNITSEVRTGGSYAGTTSYAYDTLGQLTRVNDPVENATWVYTYDRGGNILNKKKYAYTTGTVGTVQQTITYAYNSAWKDKLATYNGTTLSYDAIGNLTGDGTWTYAWAAGRQLSGMSKSGTAITYAYNNSGLRVRKTVAGVVTNYTLNGKLITHLTKGSDWMHFFYDGQGKPSIVNYKGATYRYLYNLQGDVIGLVDTSGNVVVEYKYDAWGKIIGRTGSLVSTLGYLNPFRYRGYVYDEETGLYYLRSRYYNPEWGRFVNADVLLGKRGALLSHNLFAYCVNNPIMFIDPDGLDVMTLEGDDTGRNWPGGPIGISVQKSALEAAKASGNTILRRAVLESTKIAPVAMFMDGLVDPFAEGDSADDQDQNSSNNQNKEPTNRHHIVAQKAWPASPARQVLDRHNINVNNSINLVDIPVSQHQHLHTYTYYHFVNMSLIEADRKQGRIGVKLTLKSMSRLIEKGIVPH